MRIYLGLGSNLGDRLEYLATALKMLGGEGVEILQRSSVYETEPVEVTARGDFLNMVVQATTRLPPEALLRTCQSIEERLGRERPGASRTLDIDLLYYGSVQLSIEGLVIPHPRLHQRQFVLIPLQEIAPRFIDPVRKQTIRNLLTSCPDRSRVRRLAGSRP